MKAVRVILVSVAIIIIAIQFIPSGIPGNREEDEKSIVHSGLVTEPVLSMIKRSCFDCHSNQVNLPWYSQIAPVSWLLASHINEGKEHLNFSEWEDYNKRKKIRMLGDIGEEVRTGKMPLKSYLRIHRDARLNDEAAAALVKWSEEASARLIE
jgi:hypothetical protein